MHNPHEGMNDAGGEKVEIPRVVHEQSLETEILFALRPERRAGASEVIYSSDRGDDFVCEDGSHSTNMQNLAFLLQEQLRRMRFAHGDEIGATTLSDPDENMFLLVVNEQPLPGGRVILSRKVQGHISGPARPTKSVTLTVIKD